MEMSSKTNYFYILCHFLPIVQRIESESHRLGLKCKMVNDGSRDVGDVPNSVLLVCGLDAQTPAEKVGVVFCVRRC